MMMNIQPNDIQGAAIRLVTDYGFRDARAAADEMIDAWERSQREDADEGVGVWKTIKATVVAMEAHRV